MIDCLIEPTNGEGLLSVPYSTYFPDQLALKCSRYESMVEFDLPVSYTINQRGFRYTEPTTDNVLVASGCSMTFGTGMPQDQLYCELVAKELNMECVNVGLPGTGPDIQIINAIWAVETYKPKYLLFYMSHPNRRFLATERGFMNWVPHHNMDEYTLTKIEQKIFILMDEKYNYTRPLSLIWQMYPLIQLCKKQNVNLLFRCWDKEAQQIFEFSEVFKDVKFLPDLPQLDKARDNEHAGLSSHRLFCERILNVIEI